MNSNRELLEKKSVNELIEILKSKGLSTAGEKDELVDRIINREIDLLIEDEDDYDNDNDDDNSASNENNTTATKTTVQQGGDAPLDKLTQEERIKKRIEKFGVVSPSEKLKQRAERFGIVNEKDKLKQRAERFGIVDEKDKLKQRAEKFGIVSDEEKKKNRLKRFGMVKKKKFIYLFIHLNLLFYIKRKMLN